MLRKAFRTVFCLMLCVFLVLNSVVCAAGAEKFPAVTVTVTYYSPMLGENLKWDFEYSDQWFSSDPGVYSHPVARASLGLAFAAFRTKTEQADENIVHYLTELGFSDLSSADYDRETSIETISTMIGQKKLPSGETLLAVAICGQGYKNEWLSNFDVGNDQEHKGFSASAQKVVQRVEDYIKEHDLTDVRLWMSGYSRSAAVANLTGAALMEKGLFNEENAYIYTFATPRTTREPVAYANIFNITGKFDPVVKIPYKEWGYERHGVTLYTPAQETDSDYRSKQAAADQPFYELTGLHMWNSPVMNQHLALIEAYLLANIPTAAHYDAHMSDHIANVWNEPSVEAVLTVLRAMASITADGQADAEAGKSRAEQMIDYIVSAMAGINSEDLMDASPADFDRVAFAALLVLEHIPDVYLAWMFSSDDPEQIFSDNTEYVQLIISGDADVHVFAQDGGFILSMDPEGGILTTTENEQYLRRIRPEEERPLLTATTVDDRRMIVLPGDQVFPITMIGRSASDLEYFALYYDTSSSSPSASATHILHMEPGEEYLAFCLTPQIQTIMRVDEPLWGDYHESELNYGSDQLLSALEVNQLASPNAVQVSVRDSIDGLIFLLIVFGVMFLIALIILILIIRKVRKMIRKSKKKRQLRREAADGAADSGEA